MSSPGNRAVDQLIAGAQLSGKRDTAIERQRAGEVVKFYQKVHVQRRRAHMVFQAKRTALIVVDVALFCSGLAMAGHFMGWWALAQVACFAGSAYVAKTQLRVPK